MNRFSSTVLTTLALVLASCASERPTPTARDSVATSVDGTQRSRDDERESAKEPTTGSRVPANQSALVFMGDDGKLAYKPYTDEGDRIMDYSHCGYKASEVPIPNDVPTVETIEPLPDSPAPVRRAAPEPKKVSKEEQGPMVWFAGKKRFHDARCPRAKAGIKANPENWRQITYRQGILSGLDYCSRCPKDAPRIEVKKPDPKDHVPFMAYPDGPDSRARIQAAIDKVAAMAPAANGYRGAVLLKKGAYYLKGGLNVYPGVVLRGEGDGMDGTVLVFHHPKGTAITLCKKEEPEPAAPSNEPAAPAPEPAPRFTTRIADAYVPVGSISVTVKDVGPLKVGDAVHVIKTTNWAWVKLLGMDKISGGRPWKPSAYRLHHPRRIAKIAGNRITFDVPLPQGFIAAHGGGEVVEWGGADTMPSLIGVEKLRIISNYDRAVRSVLRGRDGEGYEADEQNNMSSGIHFSGCANSWARNVTVMHTSRNSFANKNAQYLTVCDCTSREPISPLRGGRRYCFSNSDSSMILFYRCSAEYGRHPYVTGSRDAGPVAFVMSTTKGGASETHQRWASGVLYDSIEAIGGSISAGNRGGGGSGQGWSGCNVVMWNCKVKGIGVQDPPTPEQNFAIGTVLEDAESKVSGDGFVESTGTHVEPKSLFVQQLIDRIGREKAEAALK